jgi:SPP1 family predicted phage head-tail adaptor|nr:MAG TPA: Putative head tail adaptor [Caudoviricetes sp.]
MDISKLCSRITIQKNTVEVDSIGNHKAVWTDFYSCYAYANLATGRKVGQEYEAAGQTVSSDTYTFTVRYCRTLKDLDSDHYRILFGGDIYNITLVDDFQFRHETLKLTATKVRR